jgi:nucleoside-diphosphate kinase
MSEIKKEKSLVLIKPDGVKKGLIGRIISRFEETGLKIIGIKMVWANEELAKNHYFLDEAWAQSVFEKTKAFHEKEGKPLPYSNHMELGKTIQKWNMEFLTEGPVVAIALEGYHAIEIVRKMIGSTEPRQSPPGTIRGDFAPVESYGVADSCKRVLRNIVHASDSPTNGEREILLWFSVNELHSNYKTIHDMVCFKDE